MEDTVGLMATLNLKCKVSFEICQWKNFENRSTFAEVIIRSQVYCFFDSPCISTCKYWGLCRQCLV